MEQSKRNVFTLLFATSDDGFVNVRSQPSVNGRVVDRINAIMYGLGDGILLEEGTWCKVIGSKGKTGYANFNFLEKQTWYNGKKRALVAKTNCPIYTIANWATGSLCRWYGSYMIPRGTIIADEYEEEKGYYVLHTAHDPLYIPKRCCTVQNVDQLAAPELGNKKPENSTQKNNSARGTSTKQGVKKQGNTHNNTQRSTALSESDIINKIQGHWAINTVFGRADVYIDGDNLRFVANGSNIYNGKYKYVNAKESGLGYACLKYRNHDHLIVSEKGEIMYSQTEPMTHIVNGKETIRIAEPTEKEKEAAALLQLTKLGNEGKELVAELQRLRNSGMLSANKAWEIKGELVTIKDEQIKIARSLNDTKLTNEYIEQKRKLLQAFASMGY